MCMASESAVDHRDLMLYVLVQLCGKACEQSLDGNCALEGLLQVVYVLVCCAFSP